MKYRESMSLPRNSLPRTFYREIFYREDSLPRKLLTENLIIEKTFFREACYREPLLYRKSALSLAFTRNKHASSPLTHQTEVTLHAPQTPDSDRENTIQITNLVIDMRLLQFVQDMNLFGLIKKYYYL